MEKELIETKLDKIMTISNMRDDSIEKKLDKVIAKVDEIDDFLKNGFSDKIAKETKNYILKWLGGAVGLYIFVEMLKGFVF